MAGIQRKNSRSQKCFKKVRNSKGNDRFLEVLYCYLFWISTFFEQESRESLYFSLFFHLFHLLPRLFFSNCRIRTENENPDQELHEIQESIEQELAANVNDQSVIKRAFVTPTVRRALVLGKVFAMVTTGNFFRGYIFHTLKNKRLLFSRT